MLLFVVTVYEYCVSSTYYFSNAAVDRFKNLGSLLYLNRAWSLEWREVRHAIYGYINLFILYFVYYYYYYYYYLETR